MLSEIIGEDIRHLFQSTFDFCTAEDLLTFDADHPDIVRITPKGFQYYGAVFSLFYKPL